jgi:hypothetical protein
MAKTKPAAPPDVTACTASKLGADGKPPRDRPEWLIESTSAALIKSTLKALCAPLKVPSADYLDITVSGTAVRIVVLPEYKLGPYEGQAKRVESWKTALQPLVDARGANLVGAIHITPVPKNLDKIPTDEVSGISGWLRYLSKGLPGNVVDPRGFVNVYTAKEAFPDGMNRGRSFWTTYRAIKLLLSEPSKGRNEIWHQILEVARAPAATRTAYPWG